MPLQARYAQTLLRSSPSKSILTLLAGRPQQIICKARFRGPDHIPVTVLVLSTCACHSEKLEAPSSHIHQRGLLDPCITPSLTLLSVQQSSTHSTLSRIPIIRLGVQMHDGDEEGEAGYCKQLNPTHQDHHFDDDDDGN